MRVTASVLADFYASRLGGLARRMAVRRIQGLWTSCAGCDVLGLGFAGPFMSGSTEGARRTISAMPREQGAALGGAVVLADETRLPFADAVFDRVLLAHAIEECGSPHTLLREVWRVMAPEGRLLIIAANRAGWWAHSDSTPFGQGRPYSRRQLNEQMRAAMFLPTVSASALHAPPLDWRIALASADTLERAGEAVRSPFGGLVMMEAVKRLHVEPASTSAARRSSVAEAATAAPHLRKELKSD